jgi:hypothetical protein
MPNFFYLILNLILSEPPALCLTPRSPVKMIDFLGEVTFISVFDGITDIFETRFIMQLCFKQFKYTHTTVKCNIYYSDVTIDRDHQ